MIDAHHHFWNYNKTDFEWIDESMSVIQKSFLPADFAPILKSNAVEGSVLIQVNRDENENQLFTDFAVNNDFIKGTVAYLDFFHKGFEQKLEKLQGTPKLKGFREIAQGNAELYFPNEAFRKSISKLAKYDFTYDILIFEKELKLALDFARALPNNKFVIDHIAKPDIKNKSITQWSNYMKAFAALPNVSIKVSGMTTEANWNSWQKEDFYIYLDHVLACFGTKRIMYGSDWPVCLVAGSYEEQLDILKSYTAKLSITEQEDIFSNTATEFYNL